MSASPYRSGYKSFPSYSKNPYTGEANQAEWQRGYNDAEASYREAKSADQIRRDNLWNVPERAKEEYIRMEDDFSAQTVLEFMLAMHPEETE